ncbi:MAG: hypothetical protein Q9174_002029 [Haloplaca sp. 1 TL-2023]
MFENRKRARDEDEDLTWEPPVHVSKRLRALPFRTSPHSKHINTFSQSPRAIPPPLLTPALTPVETSEDEGERKNPFRSPSREKSEQLTLNSTITIEEPLDSDVDMDTSDPPQPQSSIESCQPSPCTITTPQTIFYNPQEVNNGGRIPTPIYGHFNRAERRTDMVEPTENSQQAQQELAHDLFLRRRRLPSPISEDEAMDTPEGMGGMMGKLDMGTRNSREGIPFKTNKMWGGGSPVQKGKMTISMGFRADCEKCRMRVPGHYNHWVRA